jgi:hypothetical protein
MYVLSAHLVIVRSIFQKKMHTMLNLVFYFFEVVRFFIYSLGACMSHQHILSGQYFRKMHNMVNVVFHFFIHCVFYAILTCYQRII